MKTDESSILKYGEKNNGFHKRRVTVFLEIRDNFLRDFSPDCIISPYSLLTVLIKLFTHF